MGFSVFLRNAQVKHMWVKHKTIIRNLEIFNLIMLFGIENVVGIGRQTFAQVHVIRVAAQAVAVIRTDFDRSFFHFFQDTLVGKNHCITFTVAQVRDF
ncbi:MAG: hypothetical protein RLZZ557_952 [Bacteroidota bacterium]